MQRVVTLHMLASKSIRCTAMTRGLLCVPALGACRYEAIEASGMSFRDRVLLGLREGDEFYQLDDGGMVSRDFTQTYYVGIIDILTEFNDTKKVGRLCFTVGRGSKACLAASRNIVPVSLNVFGSLVLHHYTYNLIRRPRNL